MKRMERSRGGFTLTEVLLVAAIIGALTGIAAPRLMRALDKTAATRIVADARSLDLASRAYVQSGVPLPATGAPGEFPTVLAPYVDGEIDFRFRGTVYRYVTQPALETAQLWVDHPEGSAIAAALQEFRNRATVTWTPTRTTFFLLQ